MRKALFIVLGLASLVIASACSKGAGQKSGQVVVVDGHKVYDISKDEDLEFVTGQGRLISTMVGHVEYIFWTVEGYNCDQSALDGSVRVFFPRDDYVFARRMNAVILKHNERLVRNQSGAASCSSIK